MKTPPSDSDTIVLKTKNWIEKAVIGLNLCPFAKPVLMKNQIRYQISEATETETLLRELIKEMRHLAATDPNDTETTLLIHPQVLNDFLDYNDFLDVADAALIELDLVGVLQVASFHPDYQFVGTTPDARENYTNRSPYPMLHLLREASVEKAIDSYKDADSIPDRNIALLNSLDEKSFEKLKLLLSI